MRVAFQLYLDIPDDLFFGIKEAGYENDEAIKAQMFDWVAHIWQQKEQRISTMLAEFETNPKSDYQSN
ncbi:hypothetical protein Psyc_1806 [Psychrobacter arcticus 273-4]|uniref:Uncharacterized protein n=1 Tax=Psychrobacter arcticus (strain DSM 17307 / VKM B-2377 / 273-4) TaxID=259536 RepID=Q4FQQ4_PSYA2|nr:hypothetical protein [Psychrobacter arcticus]AAZ19654.1 hypothetical protein Psyc_1806 [Psychrobacter arcticus 273-4]